MDKKNMSRKYLWSFLLNFDEIDQLWDYFVDFACCLLIKITLP